MPTLKAAIDASRAKQGAAEFQSSTAKIVQSAEQATAAIINEEQAMAAMMGQTIAMQKATRTTFDALGAGAAKGLRGIQGATNVVTGLSFALGQSGAAAGRVASGLATVGTALSGGLVSAAIIGVGLLTAQLIEMATAESQAAKAARELQEQQAQAAKQIDDTADAIKRAAILHDTQAEVDQARKLLQLTKDQQVAAQKLVEARAKLKYEPIIGPDFVDRANLPKNLGPEVAAIPRIPNIGRGDGSLADYVKAQDLVDALTGSIQRQTKAVDDLAAANQVAESASHVAVMLAQEHELTQQARERLALTLVAADKQAELARLIDEEVIARQTGLSISNEAVRQILAEREEQRRLNDEIETTKAKRLASIAAEEKAERDREAARQKATDAAKKAADEAQNDTYRLGQTVADATSQTLDAILFQSISVRDALRQTATDLARLALQTATRAAFAQIFPAAPQAHGNVFAGGSVVPFAYGDVVSSPTYFPMTGGRTGLMGEAGTEGIFPVTRDSRGRLAVSAVGAGSLTMHIHLAPGTTPDQFRSAASTIARRVQQLTRNR